MASKSPPGKASSKQKIPSKPVAVKKPLAQKKPAAVAKKAAPAVKKASPAKKSPASAAKTPAAVVKTAIVNKSAALVKAPVTEPKASEIKMAPHSPVAAPMLSEVPPISAPSRPSSSFEVTPTVSSTLPALPPLNLSVQTSAANAATGNSHLANILVVITSGGWPVTDLLEDHFTLMQHFEVPGKMTSFSNNIVSFRNAGSGAYLLQTRPNGGAPWVGGHLLGQLLVSSADDRQGQAAFKLIIR